MKDKLIQAFFNIIVGEHGVLVAHDPYGIDQENGRDPDDPESLSNFKGMLEHPTGRRAGAEIPLAAILFGQYKPVMEFDAAGLPVRWVGGDPAAERFMEFRVHAYYGYGHSMLMRYDIEHARQIKLMPAPIPSWDGVEYVDSAALLTFRTGDGIGPVVALP